MDECLEDEVVEQKSARYVLRVGACFRTVWTLLICILLVYTGTIFVFYLCFIEFSHSSSCEEAPARLLSLSARPRDHWWLWSSHFISVFFSLDIVLNFFCSYLDEDGEEIVSHRKIARRYLTGFFIIDVVACIPEIVFSAVIKTTTGFDSADANQIVRLLRMQRLASMSRVLRVARMGKCFALRHNPVWIKLMNFKELRMVSLTVFLIWLNHVAACGWYLCGVVHDNPCETWLGKRVLQTGEIVLDATPFTQWMTCMYFVVTVFTTVGFGDMSAGTMGEIFYVSCLMMLGAVIYSMVVGEVIRMMTSRNAVAEYEYAKVDMVEAFGTATQMDDNVRCDLIGFVRSQARNWLTSNFDRSDMQELLEGRHLPRALLEALPSALYNGKFCENRFFCQRHVGTLTPRLPLLVALYSSRQAYNAMEIVYQVSECPVSLYLVMSGVFAYIANPDHRGGMHFADGVSLILGGSGSAAARRQRDREDATRPKFPFQLFPPESYFGDIELVLNLPRVTVARCETKDAEALALHKMHLSTLAEEFPDFQKAWWRAALQRSQLRAQKQRQLVSNKHRVDHLHAAALVLQTFFRRRSRLKREQRKLRVGERGGHTEQPICRGDTGTNVQPSGQRKSESDLLHDKIEEVQDYIHKIKGMIAARGHANDE